MKRFELSCNSKNSGNSLVNVKELLARANELNLEGVAITDYNDVNSFYELENEISKYQNLDIIYGTKIKAIYRNILAQLDILVKNKQGLKNLYKILTITNTQKEKMDIYKLFAISKGLLIGLNVVNENIYDFLKEKNEEEIYDFFKVFDYLILNPFTDQNYVKKLIKVSNRYHKLIIASNDVRYLYKEDKKYYEIFKEKEITNYNYLMSTEEIFEEFSYLSVKEKEQIVITNPHKINILVDKYIPLLPEIEFYSEEGNKEKLVSIVYEKANKIYEDKLPDDIKKRLDEELALINDTNAYNLIINSNLVKISHDLGYETNSRGKVASSFINYLLGITKINPIEYDLDYKEFYDDNKNKILRLAINYDSRVTNDLLNYLKKEFGDQKVISCGTLGKISPFKINELIENYEEKHKIKFFSEEIAKINDKLVDIKRINGSFVGTYFCLPTSFDYMDLSPLTYFNDLTTMVDYHKIQKDIIKVAILEPAFIEMYNDLIASTNVDVDQIPLDDKNVWNYIGTNKNEDIPIFTEEREVLIREKPCTITELANIWKSNHRVLNWSPSMSHAIEYAFIFYKIVYLKYYNETIFTKISSKC